MKKYLLIFLILFGFIVAGTAEASSFIFIPKVVTVQVGQIFTLAVKVDGAGTGQYTVRLSTTFSPDLLEVTSFTFDKNWIALPQPGYDSLDNKLGMLIKTAGFPKGFSGPATFGTITFRAKKAGESTIIVGSQSFVLNAQGQSTLESRPQARVIASVGKIPEVPSTQPLPNLPQGEQNIFDIGPVVGQNEVRPGATFYILLIVLAIILGIIGCAIFLWIRRQEIIQKLKHDKDIKN